MNRLGSRGASSRMRVRFKRAWRGYKAGDEIAPPAALREELLRVRTPLGEPVAEMVDVPVVATQMEAGPHKPADVTMVVDEASELGLSGDAATSKGRKTKAKKE